jgi:ribosomal protein S4
MFLKHFEWRLDAIVYRLNFAFSLKHARQLVNRGFFTVNNKIIKLFMT